MQMVEMIEFLESKFKMRFNSEDFQLNKFRLVGGLIEIIKKHLSQDKNWKEDC